MKFGLREVIIGAIVLAILALIVVIIVAVATGDGGKDLGEGSTELGMGTSQDGTVAGTNPAPLPSIMTPSPLATLAPVGATGAYVAPSAATNTSTDSMLQNTAVTTPPTYTYHDGLCSDGNTIVDLGYKLAGNVDALKVECNTRPNCKGFTTSGWLLHTVVPQQQMVKRWTQPGWGTYQKNG